jgi:hypothetical protein
VGLLFSVYHRRIPRRSGTQQLALLIYGGLKILYLASLAAFPGLHRRKNDEGSD